MDQIIDEIVYIIFDNNIINNNPKDVEIFFNKLLAKLKINTYDSINIEDTESSSDEEEPTTSDEEFIADSSSDTDEFIDELEDEEIKIIIKEDFSEIK